MADRITNDLQKIERAMNKLRNKLKRADLDYTVQFSIDSTNPTKVVYAAQMTALAQGLRPATFISHVGVDNLIEQIKGFTKELNWEKLEIAYHQGQIHAATNTIKSHEEAIEEIKNPKEKTEEEVKEES